MAIKNEDNDVLPLEVELTEILRFLSGVIVAGFVIRTLWRKVSR